jgi:hypothetical protein
MTLPQRDELGALPSRRKGRPWILEKDDIEISGNLMADN